MEIPWLPLSVIATAVAFYLGFKNNSAYDRLWEARKIWGGIINNSRSWGTMVKNFTTNEDTTQEFSEEEIQKRVQRIVYRQIAWLYGLRFQLLIPTEWEHISQPWKKKYIERRMEQFGAGQFKDEVTRKEFDLLLSQEEIEKILKVKNRPTQILDIQSEELKELKKDGLINNFKHMELQKLITEFYALQGKCERIKKFPLPRQYANASFLFVTIFIILLPFGMVSAFHDGFHNLAEHYRLWLAIPFSIIIGWIYLVMELVGDYSENPFEGLANDVPMLSMCRTIEIDLREMLGETDLPEAIKPTKDGVLM
jgi:putative membrane protein